MTTSEVFQVSLAVLASLGGGGAIVLGLSSWLGRVWAERILAGEKHKLELLRREHEVKFAKLHLERAEAIKALALKLQELDDSLHSVLKDFKGVEEPDLDSKIQRSIKVHGEFIELYKQNRIYFTKAIDKLMHTIALCSRDTHQDVFTFRDISKECSLQLIPQLWKDREESWESARKSFYEDMQKMRDELETAFRSMLGVE